MDNINLEDIKELENEDIVIAYDEVDKYIKYLKDSIIDSTDEEESEEEVS